MEQELIVAGALGLTILSGTWGLWQHRVARRFRLDAFSLYSARRHIRSLKLENSKLREFRDDIVRQRRSALAKAHAVNRATRKAGR